MKSKMSDQDREKRERLLSKINSFREDLRKRAAETPCIYYVCREDFDTRILVNWNGGDGCLTFEEAKTEAVAYLEDLISSCEVRLAEIHSGKEEDQWNLGSGIDMPRLSWDDAGSIRSVSSDEQAD